MPDFDFHPIAPCLCSGKGSVTLVGMSLAVRCGKCGTQGPQHCSAVRAIEAWNGLFGGGALFRCLEVMRALRDGDLTEMEAAKALGVTVERLQEDRKALFEALDCPDADCTDWAHPAWWRGHEHTTQVFCGLVNAILDGQDSQGENVDGCQEPWGSTRKRLRELAQELKERRFQLGLPSENK